MRKLAGKRPIAFAMTLLGTAFAAHVTRAQAIPDAPSGSEQRREALREWQAVEEQRLAAIEDEIAVNGPLSSDLFDMYFSLATHYREGDEQGLAAAALEQALHIQRVTHGLFSPEQFAVTRELIDGSLTAGDFERAIQLETQLMRIARENLDDVRSANILKEAADRQISVYERYLAGELPPQLNISMSSGPGSRPPMNENRFIGLSNLFAARRNYFDAVGVLVNTGTPTDPRILEIERKLIRSYYLEANAGDTRPGRGVGLFRLGRDSYSRILKFAVDTDDVNVAAEGMIGLADWHLLFQRFGSALDIYADAHKALLQLGASQQLLEEIFSPEVPIALPTFNPNPLATPDDGADDSAAEYVDVRMRLSRYGRSRARSIETSAEESQKLVEKQLRRIINRSRFRPLLVDGEPQHGTEIEFRYYLDTEKS